MIISIVLAVFVRTNKIYTKWIHDIQQFLQFQMGETNLYFYLASFIMQALVICATGTLVELAVSVDSDHIIWAFKFILIGCFLLLLFCNWFLSNFRTRKLNCLSRNWNGICYRFRLLETIKHSCWNLKIQQQWRLADSHPGHSLLLHSMRWLYCTEYFPHLIWFIRSFSCTMNYSVYYR